MAEKKYSRLVYGRRQHEAKNRGDICGLIAPGFRGFIQM